MLLDTLFGATVEVLPLQSGLAITGVLPRLAAHFDGGGGPVMVGGGGDVYSKTVVGVRFGDAQPAELLVLDPHYEGRAAHDGDWRSLRHGGHAAWRPTSVLRASSFYNLALPRPLPPGASKEQRATCIDPAANDADHSGWVIEVVERG